MAEPSLFSFNYSQRNNSCSNSIISNGPPVSAEAAAMADARLQHPQLHVPLPQSVQQLLNCICDEKTQPQPDAEVRRKLGLLSEAKALELLEKIYNSRKPIRTLNGFINHMLGQEEYRCAPASPSPTKSAPAASRLQSPPSSASPISPVLHQEQTGDYGGQRPPYSYSSASPSKSARASLFQGPSSARPITRAHQEQTGDSGGLRPPKSYFSASASPCKTARPSLFQGSSSSCPITPVHQEQTGDYGGQRLPYSFSSASPSKAVCASPFQGPSSSCPITPVHQDQTRDYGGHRPLYSCSSASPSKAARASLFQGPSSASPITPVLHEEQVGDSGVPRLPYSHSSASPSKAARASLFQGPSSAPPPPTITPVRLFSNPLPLPLPQPQVLLDQPGDNGQAQAVLEALGELEFRRQFLILNYAGGMKLENVLAPETIRSWRDLPMQLFETKVWGALGWKCINREDRQLTVEWDSGKTYIYQCEVSVDGSYKFKGPCLNNAKRTLLQKELGDDNVLMVKFADVVAEKDPCGYYDNNYANYSKVAREGILVGLRRYCFFAFKDGGNKEKKKNPTSSSVKCYFIRVGSSAAIDSGGDYKFSKRRIHEARCIFMHPHTVSSVSNYMVRFSLILSKTESLIVDWSLVKVDDIDDEYCLDESGNRIYRDGKPLIHTDGTGFISEDLASLCPKDLLKKGEFSNEYIAPLLMQFRLFYKGRAVKGTFLVNKMLPPKTLQIRPSMIKVVTDPQLSDDQTVNSLEIVKVSKSHKNTYFSRNLIALLCHGGVPKEYFMEILKEDLEDTHGVFYNRRAAAKVAFNYGGMDDAYNSFKMISSGIPLEESYLQYRLSMLMKEEKNRFSKGKISSPQSYNLMGTTDPTGILETDEVCVLLESGQMSGEVLVYRHPGLHFGDVHVLKATYVKELESFVGNAKYAVFFSRKGPRSVADEMGGGDFDGDIFWVSRNPRLLECFKPSEPWIETSSTTKVASTRPSELLPDHLEDALIKLFLKSRFEPSFAMSEASDNWLAHMDQFLTLGDDSIDERIRLKAKMLKLVDIYYDALDAPKKGGKVEVPRELKAPMFPHYMERKNSNAYRSTSILGSIFDTVNEYKAEDTSNKEVEKLPSFDVEVPEECLKRWNELYPQYRNEMSSVMDYNEEQAKNKAADMLISRYKEILYGGEDFDTSTRPLDEIHNEALAIYRLCYDYAWRLGDVRKCGFAWKVAGSALCDYYMSKHQDRTFRVSFSVLKDIL